MLRFVRSGDYGEDGVCDVKNKGVGYPARWKLDGVHSSSVWVCNDDDFKYWANECNRAGYSMRFVCHVPVNALGYEMPEHDKYELNPKELD